MYINNVAECTKMRRKTPFSNTHTHTCTIHTSVKAQFCSKCRSPSPWNLKVPEGAEEKNVLK